MNKNQEARLALMKLCEAHGWRATYNTLAEDGYDSSIDYQSLIDSFVESEAASVTRP